MITTTSANVNKWGLVSSDGPRVQYESKRQLSKGCGCLVGLFALLLITLVVLVVTGNVTLFEDGSWAIGQFPYILHGCLPWGLCN